MLVYCLYQLIVDRYLIYLKLHLFWEFTRVKIGVAYIKVTVGCDGRRLILKTLFRSCALKSFPFSVGIRSLADIVGSVSLMLSPSCYHLRASPTFSSVKGSLFEYVLAMTFPSVSISNDANTSGNSDKRS